MSAPKWSPSDDELDGLARTLSPPVLSADEAEQQRTSMLASAAGLAQQSRSSRLGLVVAIGTVAAAAAALFLWLGLRGPSETATSTADVEAIGDASFTREQSWPAYRVRVDDGRVRVVVATVQDADRFVAVAPDAELEVRRGSLTMSVSKGHLDAVDVSAGRAELRVQGAPSVFLGAGDSWRPARTADVLAPPPAPTIQPLSDDEPPSDVIAPRPTRTAKPARSAAVASGSAAPSVAAPAPVESGPNPGELEFRAGMAALRSGDAAAATSSFALACKAARGDALAEDACFWVGAAANRAAQPSVARDALAQFVQKFPSSGRAGEASALLGWLLYEAGDLDGAEARFQRAATDRVPKVRASADKGLEAIKRRRTTP